MYWSVHSHSEFSALDGMGSVPDMVSRVAKMGQPALALTDHGNMAGAVKLYKACIKEGVVPFPGVEAYFVKDATDPVEKERRFHLGLLALDFQGYRGLVQLTSRSHQRDRFHRKPLIDSGDLVELARHFYGHVAILTGCYFGLVTQTLVNEGPDEAQRVTQWLDGLFPGKVFVELQNHGITHDDDNTLTQWEDEDIVEVLTELAERNGLPTVIGQDSHYIHTKHQPVHDLMKNICYFGHGEDGQFPGGPYHLATEKWLQQRFDAHTWNNALAGHQHLLDMNKMTMPALDNYKFHVPTIVKRPMARLIREVHNGPRWKDDWGPGYMHRYQHELEVIGQMGMANYFLLVKELVDWCKDNDVLINARGSVNGSLVCYLLGITNIDPLKWKTSFDRFLSLDRMKPPDVDLDVDSGYQPRLVDHLRKRFPTITRIGSWLKIGETEGGDEQGSVYVQYAAAMRRKNGAYNGVHPDHRPLLTEMGRLKVRKGPGTHSCGYVLPGDGLEVSDYLPTQLIASSGLTVTQMAMEDIDALGYVKIDVLGLSALSTISTCLRSIGREPDDWEWIPWNDARTCTALRSGCTTGIFQFDGPATMKGGRQMGVKSTKDVILCMALYRPALLAGGQTDRYLEARRGGKIPQLHPIFDPVLKDTLGVPVFQEQIMEMTKVLGMSYQDWNDLSSAVKASNDKIVSLAQGIFARIKPIWDDLCAKAGLAPDDAALAWHAVVGFTDYGFNRAHATSYGLLAYRMAYLKTHHPIEYMHACLATWAGNQVKERILLREVRRLGIPVARACVNRSQANWTIEGKKLRRGLLSIKGIGESAAMNIVDFRPPGGWPTLEDMILDVPARQVSGGKEWPTKLNGKYAVLREVGALAALGVNPM